MRRSTTIALGIAAFLAGAAAAGPAFAGYGALAYDDAGGKYGLSASEETQSKADDVAMKICGGEKCKIVFRTVAKECGAVAKAESGNAWGGGKHRDRARAELAALQNCQKHTKGQCKLRGAECNR
jgi:hypothetical protein